MQRALTIAFFAVLALIVATCALQLRATYEAVERSTALAAWVQAFGSIGAIIGAAWIASRQSREVERRAADIRGQRRESLCFLLIGWVLSVRARSEVYAELGTTQIVSRLLMDVTGGVAPSLLFPTSNIDPSLLLDQSDLAALAYQLDYVIGEFASVVQLPFRALDGAGRETVERRLQSVLSAIDGAVRELRTTIDPVLNESIAAARLRAGK